MTAKAPPHPYEPISYWDWQAPSYRPPELGRLGEQLVRWMGEYGIAANHVLEVGSGNGRIYKLVMNDSFGIEYGINYMMVDVAPEMAGQCQRNTGEPVMLWDGITLPYMDNTFDWVISFSVLLHVPPADIAQHVAELARVSRRFVFVSTYTSVQSFTFGHCFRHNYDQLFKDAGLSVVDKRRFEREKQTQWLLKKT